QRATDLSKENATFSLISQLKQRGHFGLEDKMRRLFSTVMLGFALLIPVATSMSIVSAKDDHHPKRFYDKDRRDWHPWNDGENRFYFQFRTERHWPDRDFWRLKKSQQRDYWRWRHEMMEHAR